MSVGDNSPNSPCYGEVSSGALQPLTPFRCPFCPPDHGQWTHQDLGHPLRPGQHAHRHADGRQADLRPGEVYQTWLQLRYSHLALTADIQNLLHQLRRYYFVGLITNGTSRAQWEKIERLQLQKFFDLILVSGDLPWEKPHRKIFHVACDYLGVEPRHCIMVGDKLETDILGGVEANLGGTVWIPLSSIEETGADDPRPDYRLEHVTDLPNLLPKNPKVPRFKERGQKANLPDLEDGNSNSSDGS